MTTEPLSTDELADYYCDRARALIEDQTDTNETRGQRAIVFALLAIEARLDHMTNTLG